MLGVRAVYRAKPIDGVSFFFSGARRRGRRVRVGNSYGLKYGRDFGSAFIIIRRRQTQQRALISTTLSYHSYLKPSHIKACCCVWVPGNPALSLWLVMTNIDDEGLYFLLGGSALIVGTFVVTCVLTNQKNSGLPTPDASPCVEEAARPVFVVPSSLQPAAGGVPPTHARMHPSPPPSAPEPKVDVDSQLLRPQTLMHLGCGLLIAGWLPATCQYLWHWWPATSFGRWLYYMPLVPIGGVSCGLGVSPSDVRTVRTTAWGFVLLWCALALLCACVAKDYSTRNDAAVADDEAYRYALPWLLWCVICLAFSLSLAAKAWRYDRDAACILKTLWGLGRLMCVGVGVSMGVWMCITYVAIGPTSLGDPYAPALLASVLSYLVCGLAPTPSFRERFARIYLSAL